MTTYTPRLDLPFIESAQAQKHVTHNAALERLDAIVQLRVRAFGAVPPPPPARSKGRPGPSAPPPPAPGPDRRGASPASRAAAGFS